jgi:N-acylneuraminate cytidylyltransferase
MRVAIIPARGGSKRIPRKNIKYFFGKPILAWSIEAAIKSRCFDQIICSTDDDEIANIAQEFGALTPFVRPKDLSDDHIGTIPVISHAVEYLQSNGNKIDLACCIYATAPFIQPIDLQNSLEKMQNNDLDYCFSVTSYPFPIQRSIRITSNKRCRMLQPEMFQKRSQDLEEAYHDAGQFYWGTPQSWLEGRTLFSNNTMPYVLPRYRVQDIDTMEDWKRAELMFKASQDELV